MIWIGTSGFQYPEWKGSFYPEKISAAKMLPFYAKHFPTTEINYSFRRIPSDKTLTNWKALTPEKFRFGFKALQEITHIKKLRECEGLLAAFSNALAGMNEKLGPILFQLPPFFKKDLPLLKDFLGALPKELNCAFEFRHPSWFDDETFAALKSHNAALCIAESEKLATPLAFTANFAYFRLRREDYTRKDISRWAKVIHQPQLSDTYVYFKHEETGTGPKFAKQLISDLGV
jgi:uncharacterized protein YecE (DUF72 family)